MCGIVALFFPKEQVSELSLKQSVNCLKHRGPDGQGFWISSDHRVALGHTRLSIIDIDHGEQPISNQDKTLNIVVNGEFYGFESIQSDLRRWGYKFKTNSDSEIALHLYDKFGTQCLQSLRGEFAFVIWDEKNKLLFAARDRFGIKPLYYTNYQNNLYIASEIKSLIAAGVTASWDYETFWQTEWGIFAPERTMFSNIYQVPPGHYLIASDSGIKLQSYWDFNYPPVNQSLTVKTFSESDYIQQLRYTLEEAVELRLKADVPVSLYLSGGLDSSVVGGIAAKKISTPLEAFTLAFDHKAYNEESRARETAAHIGANLHIVPISQFDLAENFSDSIWNCEMLCTNGNTTAKYILSKFARDAGYKVVLTGEGSDEIFGGYNHFRQDVFCVKQQKQGKLKQQFEDNDASKVLSTVQLVLGFVPTWMQVYAKGYLQSFPLYSSEFITKFCQKNVYRIFLNHIDVQKQLIGREYLHQSLYLWSKTILPNYILRMLGDGVEMAHSIEGRLPFLDHKVVELVTRIPSELKIRGLTEKYVLREAAKLFITETMYNRRKHPFLAPPSTSQLNEPLQQFIQDTLRSSKMSNNPFYDHTAIIKLLDQLPKMDNIKRFSFDTILMKMLSVYFLQERFGIT